MVETPCRINKSQHTGTGFRGKCMWLPLALQIRIDPGALEPGEAGDPSYRAGVINDRVATQEGNVAVFWFPKPAAESLWIQYVQLQNGDYNGPTCRSTEVAKHSMIQVTCSSLEVASCSWRQLP